MAEGRSLADLRLRREALVRSMEHNRAQIGSSLRAVSARAPEVETLRQWIVDHPALSSIGAFTAGMLLPSLIAPTRPQQPSLLAGVLGPLLQDGARSLAALFAQGQLEPPASPQTPPDASR